MAMKGQLHYHTLRALIDPPTVFDNILKLTNSSNHANHLFDTLLDSMISSANTKGASEDIYSRRQAEQAGADKDPSCAGTVSVLMRVSIGERHTMRAARVTLSWRRHLFVYIQLWRTFEVIEFGLQFGQTPTASLIVERRWIKRLEMLASLFMLDD